MLFHDDLIFSMVVGVISILHNRPRLRKNLLIISCVGEIASIILYVLIKNRIINIYFGNGSTPGTNGMIADILIVVMVLLSFCLILVICSFSNAFQKWRNTSQVLNEISERKQSIEKRIDEQQGAIRIQDIIQLNLSQLNEYYTINKSQSKQAYTFSVSMILVGFLLILVAVGSAFLTPENISVTLIISVAGLLAEFIGATSLNLYKESNKHVNEFLNRLTYLQKVMLAIELVDRIDSENKKEEQLSSIITNLMKAEK